MPTDSDSNCQPVAVAQIVAEPARPELWGCIYRDDAHEWQFCHHDDEACARECIQSNRGFIIRIPGSSAPPASVPDVARDPLTDPMDRLNMAGRALSNLAHAYKQRKGVTLTEADCNQFAKWQEEYDLAWQARRFPTAPGAPQ